MKEQSIKSAEDFIKAIKRSTDLISIKMNNKEIIIPIRYNAHATQTYMDSYESTKDKRNSFCSMIEAIIDSSKNMFKDNIDIQNITVKDIEAINDNDLKKLGECVINQSKDLTEVYNDNSVVSFYEDFHEAIMFEYNKFKKHMEETAKNFASSVHSTIKPFAFMQNSSMSNLISTISDMKNIADNNYEHNLNEVKKPVFELLEPKDIYTNKLLEKQIKADENIANILLQNQEENRRINEEIKKANKESTRFNIKNYRIMVATLIATIISIIIGAISLWVAIK